MQKITPFLWFDDQAEEAMNFYVSVFKNSKVGRVTRYGEGGPGPKGTVMSATFQLDGQDFFALNGGPQFKFTPAISFFVNCETQQEVDELWEKLSEGGEKAKMRLAKRQIRSVVANHSFHFRQTVARQGGRESKRVMQAMLQMDKIDIQRLQQAYDLA